MKIDNVMIPSGLVVMAVYHGWLLFTILRHPKRTIIGLNAIARSRRVTIMMADPSKNGILPVQTLRNNIMASTVLGTTAITLTSLISVFAGVINPSNSKVDYINARDSSFKFFTISVCFFIAFNARDSSFKFFTISVCFFIAFLCHVQSIRYYAQVSFLVTVASTVSTTYIVRSLNKGNAFWSIGLRIFYVLFTLFLWIFGPIPMFVCCVLMCGVLYFLDFTSECTMESFNEEDDYYALI